MKTKLLFSLLLLFGLSAEAQTCNGNTFNSPGAPSSCTYTYTSSGWENASGTPIAAPQSIDTGETLCILADNSDTLGTSKFKGTFYLAEGVTFDGTIPGFSGATLIVEGTATFSGTNPSLDGTNVYIHDTGFMKVPGDLQPNGDSQIHVDGELENGGFLNVTGSARVIVYEDATFTVANGAQISGDSANCGLIMVQAGEVHTGGGSSLINQCSLYIQEDFVLDGPYTNDGLIAVKGDLSFNGHALTNNDILMVKNLYLNNDDIVGNGKTSTLLVESHAEMTSGSTVTGLPALATSAFTQPIMVTSL